MPNAPNKTDLTYQELAALKDDAEFAAKPLELKRWIFEQRLDYAWNAFDFHAKQRMSMFNFFLVFVGFVLSAYATLLRDGSCEMSSFLAFLAAVLGCIFIRLEKRNEELVNIAEDVLGWLEKDILFADYERKVVWPHRRDWIGQMNKHRDTVPLGIFQRQEQEDIQFNRSKNEHGKWLPWFQRIIVLAFLFLALIPWFPKTITIHSFTIPINRVTCK